MQKMLHTDRTATHAYGFSQLNTCTHVHGDKIQWRLTNSLNC